ncbi:MAG: hypothetical protein ACRCZP_05215, partial [Phycicoccus sp.]
FDRLVNLQDAVSWAENRRLEGRDVEVLVAPGEGRKDGETNRSSGRARDNRLVHFSVPPSTERPRPGDLVTVEVTYGAPHHLVADSGPGGGRYAVRRTAGGDAWNALQDAPVAGAPAVALGMPSVGIPVQVTQPAAGCTTEVRQQPGPQPEGSALR